MVRTIASLVVGALLLCTTAARAHDIVWLENEAGMHPEEPLELPAGTSSLRTFYVTNQMGELCTVFVTILPIQSPPLIKWKIDTTLPDVEVPIDVQPLRAPIGGDETMILEGDWHASGLPLNADCNAIQPRHFAVPVRVRGAPSAQQANSATTGDPLSTATGEITASMVDLSLGGPLPLYFARA